MHKMSSILFWGFNKNCTSQTPLPCLKKKKYRTHVLKVTSVDSFNRFINVNIDIVN